MKNEIKNFSYSLLDIIYYIVFNYKWKYSLSNARLTKLIFILDWNYSLEKWKQATNIKWYFDTYWPYVQDIINLIDSKNDIFYKWYRIFFKWYWTEIKIKKELNNFKLPIELKKSIDFVLEKTEKLEFNDFIKFVYSLYPIQISNRYTNLDLISLSKDYKKI